MALRYSNPHKTDIDVTNILRGNYTKALIDPIPKKVHFVHTEVKELTWLDWAAVRGAVVNLGVKKIYIWLPEKAELKGWMWDRVLQMPEVKLRRIAMPKSFYGGAVKDPERQADIIRLKVLYEEGGIFMDNDLVAFRSLNDVIYSPATRSTVMALQHRGDGIPNGFIMSKPGSPLLKRWLHHYRETRYAKDEKIWDQLSTTRPYTMYQDKDPDLTVLVGKSWFYPLSAEEDVRAPLKALWFGKSWHDISESYGAHFWHPMDKFAKLVRPQMIRMIDTPFFCQVRKLFDNLDEDGYYSEPPETNLNCSSTWIKDLRERDHRMFLDYKITTDVHEMKIIDSSGFNNHGWAVKGLPLLKDTSSAVTSRNVTAKSYAVLPVPVDWDARVWTVRTTIQVDLQKLAPGISGGLFKIRMETEGEILVRIMPDYPYPGINVRLEWHGNSLAKKIYQRIDEETWTSAVGLKDLEAGPHEMALTFDRRTQGIVKLYLDGQPLANGSLPLVSSPKIGQEIWFNAQDWDKLDTGFRGTLHRFTMFADALPPSAIAKPIPSPPLVLSKLQGNIEVSNPGTTSSPMAFLFPFFIVMTLVLVLVRTRKGLIMAIPEYTNRVIGYARNVSRSTMNFLNRSSRMRYSSSNSHYAQL